MGLMYIFPVSEEEVDRIEIKNKAITVKSYGLPLLFWGYFLIISAVTFLMWMASKALLLKMMNYDNDFTLIVLAYSAMAGLFLTPLTMLIILFYEKHLIKCGCELTIIHKIFFLKVVKKKIQLDGENHFTVVHYLDSPNMARLNDHSDLQKYKNRGYFELLAKSMKGPIRLDRHSSKSELLNLKTLLEKY